VERLGVGHPAADVRQILDGNRLAVVSDRLSDQRLRHPVQVVLDPPGFPVTHLVDRAVGRLRARLLEAAAHVLVLAAAVGEIATAPELAGTGDGDVLHTEINAEHRSVLGLLRLETIFFHNRV
jgi:hypothetical protein